MIIGNRRGSAKMATSKRATQSDRIVDAALELADERGWADVRLHQIAERAGLALAEVRSRFRDQDAVANAWFARALTALVAAPPDDLADRRPPERLHAVIMRWFDALAPHRATTAQMLQAKLYVSHPHHWVPLIFELSRLMHWFLDAARIASTGRARQLAEVGLTAIFLATLRIWLRDDSMDCERTRRYLRRRLAAADRWLNRLG
jgi:AcrR family transcriptional regulator